MGNKVANLKEDRKEQIEDKKKGKTPKNENAFLSRESRELIYRYLKGELKISELPDECFLGRALTIIKENEKKKYEHSMEIAHDDEMLMQRVQAYYDFNAQFIKDKIKEVRYKNQGYSPDEM